MSLGLISLLYFSFKPDISIYCLFAQATDAHLSSVFQYFESNACRFVASGTNEHNIRDGNRCFTLNYACLSDLLSRSTVCFNHIYAFDEYPVLFWVHEAYFTFLSLVLAGDDEDIILFPNFHLFLTTPPAPAIESL
jgi:hypothetical protein